MDSGTGYVEYRRTRGRCLFPGKRKVLRRRRTQHGWSPQRFHAPVSNMIRPQTFGLLSEPPIPTIRSATWCAHRLGKTHIYCIGVSAGGQTTATDPVFRYNPVTDTIDVTASPWAGDSDGITLPSGFGVFNGKLYILRGFRINTAMTDAIWEFTLGTNT